VQYHNRHFGYDHINLGVAHARYHVIYQPLEKGFGVKIGDVFDFRSQPTHFFLFLTLFTEINAAAAAAGTSNGCAKFPENATWRRVPCSPSNFKNFVVGDIANFLTVLKCPQSSTRT